MKKTPLKALSKLLFLSLMGMLLFPTFVSANETSQVKSGGNDIGIEFEEDYVPAESKPKPEPKPVPKPKQPIKTVYLPQTNETTTMKPMILGTCLILGLGMIQQKRRGSIEKE